MNLLAIIVLFVIVLDTFGFTVTMWKEKQRVGAFATLCLVSFIIVL